MDNDTFDFISTECLLNECAIFIKLSFVLDLLLESCILLGKNKGTSKSTLHYLLIEKTANRKLEKIPKN